MDIDPKIGLPNEASVFEEIAKGEQKINVSTTAKRYGKLVTLVSGFDKTIDVKGVAKALKEKLACGGTVKNGVIELQGNHKKQMVQTLSQLGFTSVSVN